MSRILWPDRPLVYRMRPQMIMLAQTQIAIQAPGATTVDKNTAATRMARQINSENDGDRIRAPQEKNVTIRTTATSMISQINVCDDMRLPRSTD